MNNLVSYSGLTDGRMRASEKDLPVKSILAYLTISGQFSILLANFNVINKNKIHPAR